MYQLKEVEHKKALFFVIGSLVSGLNPSAPLNSVSIIVITTKIQKTLKTLKIKLSFFYHPIINA